MAEIKSNAKLKNLPPDDLETMWSLRHPEEKDGKVFSYTEILAELPRLLGFTSSLGALSEFYSWLTLKREIEESFARAEQAKLEFLTVNPDTSPESLQALGQMIFTSKSIQTGDLQGFVQVMAAWEKRQTRLLDQEKFALIKAKAAQADAAKEVLGTSLSPEEQNRRLRDILK